MTSSALGRKYGDSLETKRACSRSSIEPSFASDLHIRRYLPCPRSTADGSRKTRSAIGTLAASVDCAASVTSRQPSALENASRTSESAGIVVTVLGRVYVRAG